MVVKLYISTTSGNAKVKKEQQLANLILTGSGITFEEVDLSDVKNHELKASVLDAAEHKGKERSFPQVFLDEIYLGNYEDLETANECGFIRKFLRQEELSMAKTARHEESSPQNHNHHEDHQETIDIVVGESNHDESSQLNHEN